MEKSSNHASKASAREFQIAESSSHRTSLLHEKIEGDYRKFVRGLEVELNYFRTKQQALEEKGACAFSTRTLSKENAKKLELYRYQVEHI